MEANWLGRLGRFSFRILYSYIITDCRLDFSAIRTDQKKSGSDINF
jgi:hypothetical protein